MYELRNITAGYGEHVVLRDVDLTVPENSVVALLGPNGAGKTTLLRVASGLMAPTTGSLVLDGNDVTGWSSDRLARAGICHVPEGRGIFGALTVRDNIRLQTPPDHDGQGFDEAVAAFPRLGERLDQAAGTMSGGEQQMLAMASAYVSQPSVVLLDEVSMGLAPKIIDEIFEHLRHLAAKGVALLLVEQYVTRALQMADYVYILNRGRVQFVGEPKELGDDRLLSYYLGEVTV